MKRQRSLSNPRVMSWATLSAGWLTVFSTVPALAASGPVDPASTSASGDWLEVIVGFLMLLVIGLGGLWFTQHQMKFR
jgi:hypothetical protein